MVRDLARVVPGVRNVLTLGCALALGTTPAGPAADPPASPAAAPVMVVVRTGTLVREEVSPGSKGGTPEAWNLALTGTVLTDVESPAGGDATTLASLRASLFPASASLGATRGRGPALLDLADTAALPSELVGDDRRKAIPLRDLETLFGAPEPPTVQEADAVSSLQGSLRGGAGEPAPAARRLASRARLHALATEPVSLVRLAAKGGSPLDVARRDGMLATLCAVAGDQGHLIVLNLPEGDSVADGEGSAFLRGPRLRSGWIVARRVSLADVAGLVRVLRAGATPAEGALKGGEEALRDVLR